MRVTVIPSLDARLAVQAAPSPPLADSSSPRRRKAGRPSIAEHGDGPHKARRGQDHGLAAIPP